MISRVCRTVWCGRPLFSVNIVSGVPVQVSLARLGAGFGSALTDIFQTESLRILAGRSRYIYPAKNGAYFAARRIASAMLTSLTIPLPAISNAVP